jgi:hypothetical protein
LVAVHHHNHGQLKYGIKGLTNGVEPDIEIRGYRKGKHHVTLNLGKLVGVIKEQLIGPVDGDFIQILNDYQEIGFVDVFKLQFNFVDQQIAMFN